MSNGLQIACYFRESPAQNVNDARHEKTDLKVLVVVIPKEGLAGVVIPKEGLAGVVIPKEGLAGIVIPKEGLAGWSPFFGYDTDKGVKICFLVTRINVH